MKSKTLKQIQRQRRRNKKKRPVQRMNRAIKQKVLQVKNQQDSLVEEAKNKGDDPINCCICASVYVLDKHTIYKIGVCGHLLCKECHDGIYVGPKPQCLLCRKPLQPETAYDCHRITSERESDSLVEQNRLQSLEYGWGSIQRRGPNRFPSASNNDLDAIQRNFPSVSNNGWGAIQRTGHNRLPSGSTETSIPAAVVVPINNKPTNADRRNMRAWQRSHNSNYPNSPETSSTQTTHTNRQPYQTLRKVYRQHLNSVSEKDIIKWEEIRRERYEAEEQQDQLESIEINGNESTEMRWEPQPYQVVDMTGESGSINENKDSGARESALMERLENWFDNN